MSADGFDDRSRAEDVLLGSLGFGEEAQLLKIERCGDGYRGNATWPDGETFEFQSEEIVTDLERWALSVLLSNANTGSNV